MPKLAIADPSLTDHKGHHYQITNLVSEAAREAGFDPVWLVNRKFKIEDINKAVSVFPVYSFTMYDKYRANSDNSIPSISSSEVIEEIYDSIDSMNLTAEDHVLFHTAYYDVFEAFLQLCIKNQKLLPVIHLCTPYDESTMPGRPDDTAVVSLLKRLAEFSAIETRIYLWAETPQLATHYREMLSVNVYQLPLPISKTSENQLFQNESIVDEFIRIVYLGAAREEKGFTSLPKLVDLCHEDDFTRRTVRFVIQATPQIVGYNKNILDAINKLETFGKEFVTLIRYSLDVPTYHKILWQSEIVLLLYDEANYRIRGSGIAVEAASLGKCLLATKGTFCESLIDRGGGLGVRNPSDAFNFIRQYACQPELYRLRGKHQAFFYNKQNSGVRYIDRLVYRHIAANRVWSRPSAYVAEVAPFLVQ